MVCQLLLILEVQGSNFASSPLYALKYFLGLSFTFITCAYIYDSHLVPIVAITPFIRRHIAPSRFCQFHTIFTPLPKIFKTSTPTKLHVLRYVPRKECEISANGINHLLALSGDIASYSSASNFLSSLPLSVSWVLYRFSDATAQVSRTSVEDPSQPFFS